MLRIIQFAIASSFLLVTGALAQSIDDNYIVKASALPVAEAVNRIEAAIENAPPKLMAMIDHGANASDAGFELDDTVLFILGAPPVGTPIMQANRLAGLDLPAKILVFSADGRTQIAYLAPERLADRHGVSDAASIQIAQMAKVLDAITSAGVE